MCSEPEYLEWLMAEDEASREARLERLRWLVENFGEPRHLLFWGGPISYRAFEEARLCFLNGQFIATTLLCQVILEHMLAALFHSARRDDLEGSGFKRLIDEAVKERFITPEEYDAFDRIRERRNPLVHYRDPMNQENVMYRLIREDKTLEQVFEDDAKMALSVIFNLLSRHPFAFETED